MCLDEYILAQLQAHPSMQPQDVVKLCYQASFGAEHLLGDVDAAKSYFDAEFAGTPASELPLYEEISDGYARVNLARWKKQGLPGDWLFRLFCASAVQNSEGREKMQQALELAEKLVPEFSFSKEEWFDYVNQYKKRGMPSVHHSDIYRQAEKPAYRIVRKEYLRLLPILKKAAACASPCIIAIDGRAGAGKSTLALELAFVLDCDIVRMDDFFLPTELRTAERLDAPGGNVHYERFSSEVLPKLRCTESFVYQVFSCAEMQLNGSREIRAGEYRIVEGSYSMHPQFGNYWDVSVFCAIRPEKQLERIIKRDGPEYAEVFRSRWIPMEEKYFKVFDIVKKADIILIP